MFQPPKPSWSERSRCLHGKFHGHGRFRRCLLPLGSREAGKCRADEMLDVSAPLSLEVGRVKMFGERYNFHSKLLKKNQQLNVSTSYGSVCCLLFFVSFRGLHFGVNSLPHIRRVDYNHDHPGKQGRLFLDPKVIRCCWMARLKRISMFRTTCQKKPTSTPVAPHHHPFLGSPSWQSQTCRVWDRDLEGTDSSYLAFRGVS